VKKRMDGNVRVITTPDGHEVREHMVTVDAKNRRVGYTIPEQPPGITSHFASMEILPKAGGGCTLRWITDYWPEPPAALAGIYEQAFKDLTAAVAKGRP